MKRLPCGCYFHADEFRPIDWKQREFVRGNFSTFGLANGLRANLTLLSPLLNTLLNWKHRGKTLSGLHRL